MYPRHFIDTKVIKNPLVYFCFFGFLFPEIFFHRYEHKMLLQDLIKRKKKTDLRR